MSRIDVRALFIDRNSSLTFKELGFNHHCLGWWHNEKSIRIGLPKKTDSMFRSIEAITWEQAFEWLLYKYNIGGYTCRVMTSNDSPPKDILPPYKWVYGVIDEGFKPLKRRDELIEFSSRSEARQALLTQLLIEAQKNLS